VASGGDVMKQIVDVGDIVIVWRPSLLLREYHKAKIIRIVNAVYLIRPLGWPFTHWIGERDIEGVFQKAHTA
jgi:hypothetical protein